MSGFSQDRNVRFSRGREAAALHGTTSPSKQCTSTLGRRASAGADSQRARGAHGRGGPHGEMERPALGRAPRTSLCWPARGSRRNRTTARWQPLAALPRPLSAAGGLPRRAATIGKSFRPTASRSCRSKTETPNQNQNQIHSSCQPPLEATVEADISILRKTGHFYFALTATGASPQEESPLSRGIPYRDIMR